MVIPDDLNIDMYRKFCKKTFGTYYLLEIIDKAMLYIKDKESVNEDAIIVSPLKITDFILDIINNKAQVTSVPKCVIDILTHNYIISPCSDKCYIEYKDGVTYVYTTLVLYSKIVK